MENLRSILLSQPELPVASALAPSESSPRISRKRSRGREPSGYIPVLGYSGSGKTSFIRTLYSGSLPGEMEPSHRTVDAATYHVAVAGGNAKFKLIDTPGFKDEALGDIDILKKITSYLWRAKIQEQGITGVIYIHHTKSNHPSKKFQQNLAIILHMLLGRSGLGRLTILIPQSRNFGVLPHHESGTYEIDELYGEAFDEIRAEGARILVTQFPWERSEYDNILMPYAAKHPISAPVQQLLTLRDSMLDLISPTDKPTDSLNETMLPQEPTVVNKRNETVAELQESQARVTEYQNQVKELNALLEESRASVVSYQSIIEELRANQQASELALRQKNQQIQHEYASLRSEAQLKDDEDEEGIVRVLESLNRSIEEIGSLVSAYLVDNYVRASFRNPAAVTSLDARRIDELKQWFGHQNGHPSLVAASNDMGLGIEDFFDFTIRLLLCSLLMNNIFFPFHPLLSPSESGRFHQIYREIQKQGDISPRSQWAPELTIIRLLESQYTAGKWRSVTFSSLHTPKNSRLAAERVEDIRESFFSDCLTPLTELFFGKQSVSLRPEHLQRIHEIIQRAWDWNLKLKRDVVMLGDLQPTFHNAMSEFDRASMEEVEPDSKKPRATSVLATLGLGLLSTQAVGGGCSPVHKIIRKAVVVTDTWYH